MLTFLSAASLAKGPRQEGRERGLRMLGPEHPIQEKVNLFNFF